MASLSGPYGIGVLVKEAFEFIDFLHDCGFHAWQILPVEPPGYGDSPYRCLSSFAGEPLLIDPGMLLEMGLVTDEELIERKTGFTNDYIDYDIVRRKQRDILKIAFSRQDTNSYTEFSPFWLDDYALYMALMQHYDNYPWQFWSDKSHRTRDTDAMQMFKENNQNEIEFHKFVQWLFDMQWNKLHDYAKQRNISIIGDLPIYVSEDSVEVWSRRELFNADEDGNFLYIGGVPPDYFTTDGQCWGNPIYNWELMKSENYSWWITRLKESLNRYDVVRLDHFRGFADYWRIPGGSDTARAGKWVKGPGMSLFNALRKAMGDLSLSLFAEDLGVTSAKVEKLLKDSGMRCMRLLQFGFLGGGEISHLPHNIPYQSTVYTGTHDNTPTLAWMEDELTDEKREHALSYIGFEGDWKQRGANTPIVKAWLRTLFMTPSSLAIVPLHDMLGYGSEARINIPGTASGNWRFRLPDGALDEIDIGFYKELHKTYLREDPVK